MVARRPTRASSRPLPIIVYKWPYILSIMVRYEELLEKLLLAWRRNPSKMRKVDETFVRAKLMTKNYHMKI